MKRYFFVICLGAFFSLLNSCSHLGSGQNVLLGDESLKEISQKYGTPEWVIRNANQGKHFIKGEWIFVPTKKGLMSREDFITRYGLSTNPVVPLGNGDYIWPVPASKVISSGFGKRWGRQHEGIDIPAQVGVHILSTNDGVVVYAGDQLTGYGNMIVISHPDGFFSVYAHNKKNFVKKGVNVHKGQVIATIGKTGRTTGPHLHFEIRTSDKAYDPVTFFDRNQKFHIASR